MRWATLGLIGAALAGCASGGQSTPNAPPLRARQPADACGIDRLVFFDWDSTAVTPRGREIAAGTVRSIRHSFCGDGKTHIALLAHTDRSGSEEYNLDLSRRRGEAIASALVDVGYPADRIVVEPLGESQPLVPTPDGVREPQNRRVQLLLR